MRIGFSSNLYEVTELTGSVNVVVVKNGSNDISLSVFLRTNVDSALGMYAHCMGRGIKSTFRGGVCMFPSLPPVGSDYTALSLESSEVVFSPAESEQSRNITISIINDDVHEDIEQFTVQLSLPSGSTGVVLDEDSATVQIVDEDRECQQ